MCWNVAVKVLFPVTGANNSRTQAPKNKRLVKEVFENGKYNGMIDYLKKKQDLLSAN